MGGAERTVVAVQGSLLEGFILLYRKGHLKQAKFKQMGGDLGSMEV